MNVRPVTAADREWIAEIVTGAFGSVQIVSHGELIEDASLLDGFAVEHDGRPIGCALVNLVDNDAELVALVTTYRGAGAGTALLEAVVERAEERALDAAVAQSRATTTPTRSACTSAPDGTGSTSGATRSRAPGR